MVIELIDGEDDRIGLTVKKRLNTTCLETYQNCFFTAFHAPTLYAPVFTNYSGDENHYYR